MPTPHTGDNSVEWPHTFLSDLFTAMVKLVDSSLVFSQVTTEGGAP